MMIARGAAARLKLEWGALQQALLGPYAATNHAQHKRAQEFGRGRHAQAPWQIPWQGWKDILWRTYYQIGEDRLLAVAAGLVFYGLLAVFPAVTALVSLYGLFASPSAISDQLSLLVGILPQGTVEILREQIGRLTAGSGQSWDSALSSGLPSPCGARTQG
jgi:hypothetical protein